MDIGIIGAGDMGSLYASLFSAAGHQVNVCDLPEKTDALKKKYAANPNVRICPDGSAVSRESGLIIYSMEAENFDPAVRTYGSFTREGAIVMGQSSVMTPEIRAFEQHLDKNVPIFACHSLHGPAVDPVGQSLVFVRYRSSESEYMQARSALECLGSTIIEHPDYKTHDRITADTQVALQTSSVSTASAWASAGFYPWANPAYASDIDAVKVFLMARVMKGKSHVFAGLSILNPFAPPHIHSYAESVRELYSLMARRRSRDLGERVYAARDYLLKKRGSQPPLLERNIIKKCGLSFPETPRPNSHLSRLAVLDAWARSETNPYENNSLCGTPPYRLLIGSTEWLFDDRALLDESLETAVSDPDILSDDLHFLRAVSDWDTIIGNSDLSGYKRKFEQARAFFGSGLDEPFNKSNILIKVLSAKN